MKSPVGFIGEIFKQPLWVVVWVNALAAINLLSVMFLEHALAQVILGIFLFQLLIMIAMYMYFGFEKILGLAHILWFPLLGFITFNIYAYTGYFFYYLAALSLCLLVSLVFDIYDVITFFKQQKV